VASQATLVEESRAVAEVQAAGDNPLTVVQLTAENFKRIKAIRITPTGPVVPLTGRNAQGKSSVLDALWTALCGGDASRSTPMPVRVGEKFAKVEVDLGDLVVTRKWSVSRTVLEVASKDGLLYRSPQSVLDELVGRLSFDPLAFTRLSAKDQRDQLAGALGLDICTLDTNRRKAYELRTDLNRSLKQDCALLDSLGASGERIDQDEALSEAVLLRQDVAKAREAVITRERLEREKAAVQKALAASQAEVARLAELLAEIDETLEGCQHAQPQLDELTTRLDAAEERLSDARAYSAVANQRSKLEESVADLKRRSAEQTAAIEKIDRDKAELLADADMPVDGLGFDDDGVTLNGVPFGQASAAEKLRVSMAVAMAANPTVRVVAIRDGSLMDPDTKAEVERLATEAGFQVWIEDVASEHPARVVIEDGEVVS